jgi:hypothetical protein
MEVVELIRQKEKIAKSLVKSLDSEDLAESIYTSKGHYVTYNIRPFEQQVS